MLLTPSVASVMGLVEVDPDRAVITAPDPHSRAGRCASAGGAQRPIDLRLVTGLDEVGHLPAAKVGIGLVGELAEGLVAVDDAAIGCHYQIAAGELRTSSPHNSTSGRNRVRLMRSSVMSRTNCTTPVTEPAASSSVETLIEAHHCEPSGRR